MFEHSNWKLTAGRLKGSHETAMRNTLRVFTVFALALSVGSAPRGSTTASECDVKGLYKTLAIPAGSIALTLLGETHDVDLVLAPSSLGAGDYDVSVTRKGKDVYHAEGTSTYILTKYCYEYAYSEKAVLRYGGLGILSSGKLVFSK
jgi:hypothetical protein